MVSQDQVSPQECLVLELVLDQLPLFHHGNLLALKAKDQDTLNNEQAQKCLYMMVQAKINHQIKRFLISLTLPWDFAIL